MARFALHVLHPLTAALVVSLAAPAAAQCRLCDAPVTTRAEPGPGERVQLQVETSLSFDRLVVYGEGEGAAVIRPDGTSNAQGTVSNVGPRAMVGSAMVIGEPGRFVRIDLPHRIDLYSLSGGRIVFDDVVSDLPALPRLDSAGHLSFRFGGRVRITGDADGAYRGNLPIDVEYQ